MGYRDDFYVAENLIGYTGDLHSFPTVYFKKGDEFGHITQKHDSGTNVGRGSVRKDSTYTIGNEMVKGKMKLLEKRRGKVFHQSRSTLTRIDDMTPDDKAIVLQAIWTYTDEKYIPATNQK